MDAEEKDLWEGEYELRTGKKLAKVKAQMTYNDELYWRINFLKEMTNLERLLSSRQKWHISPSYISLFSYMCDNFPGYLKYSEVSHFIMVNSCSGEFSHQVTCSACFGLRFPKYIVTEALYDAKMYIKKACMTACAQQRTYMYEHSPKKPPRWYSLAEAFFMVKWWGFWGPLGKPIEKTCNWCLPDSIQKVTCQDLINFGVNKYSD